MTNYPANLCNNCGFGNKKDNCCKCNNWMGNNKIPARLCADCGFGNKKDNCCKCNNWMGGTQIPANLCSNCGFGNKKDNCCKCGKWAPWFIHLYPNMFIFVFVLKKKKAEGPVDDGCLIPSFLQQRRKFFFLYFPQKSYFHGNCKWV